MIALWVVLTVGALLRLGFLYAWRPALTGFPDSSVYLADASLNPFRNASRPAGYGRFLAMVHSFSSSLAMVPLVQHALGLSTAGLAWIATRRLGAPVWAALVPAAVVALGGAQLWLEHAVVSEAVFTFCMVAGLAATVEAGRSSRARTAVAWSVLAALALAVAATLRLPALFVMPIFGLWVLLARGRPTRTQLGATAAFAIVAASGVLGYMAWYESGTGRFAFTRTGFYNSYARVATFADCSKFTPPAGTAKLCPQVPLEDRLGHEWWIFDGASPAFQSYGPSFAGEPPPHAADETSRFVRAVILNQPVDYLAQIGRDAWRVISPGAPSTIGQGNSAAGYGNEEMVSALTDPGWMNNAVVAATYNGYYDAVRLAVTDKGWMGFFRGWERAFRFTGPLMALIVLLALASPWLAARPMRRAAWLLGATGLVLLVLPILTSMYDARYVVPSLPFLAASAALAGAGLGERTSARRRRTAATT